ncbi:MAG: glycosyltransferase [Bacteroidota bacterium]|jgi:glycosyltransferase involved in cell wall biosynthesis
MKIVLIGPAYPIRGGNALFVAYLYESLAATNDVQVISYSRLYPGFLFPGVRQTDISGVAIKKHPATHIIDCINPFTWWKAAHHAASANPDMLVFTWWNPFFGFIVRIIASTFKRHTKKPVVIIAENVISHEGRWIDVFLTKIALQTADRFLVLSKVVEEGIKKLYPQIKVFRSSLPIYDCYQTPEHLTQQQAQQQLGLEGKNVLLFFGYIRQYKGLMNIIEALPLIRKQVSNAHLLVVGEFYDNLQPYFDTIKRLDLGNDITIINEYVANEAVHLYFTAANLAVLPYNEATQSGILSIAYGFAKPVVVTDVGGLAELVDDDKTGFIIPPHDNTKLADSIIRYFKENREQDFSRNIEAKRQENSFSKIRIVFEEIESDLKSERDTKH